MNRLKIFLSLIFMLRLSFTYVTNNDYVLAPSSQVDDTHPANIYIILPDIYFPLIATLPSPTSEIPQNFEINTDSANTNDIVLVYRNNGFLTVHRELNIHRVLDTIIGPRTFINSSIEEKARFGFRNPREIDLKDLESILLRNPMLLAPLFFKKEEWGRVKKPSLYDILNDPSDYEKRIQKLVNNIREEIHKQDRYPSESNRSVNGGKAHSGRVHGNSVVITL